MTAQSNVGQKFELLLRGLEEVTLRASDAEWLTGLPSIKVDAAEVHDIITRCLDEGLAGEASGETGLATISSIQPIEGFRRTAPPKPKLRAVMGSRQNIRAGAKKTMLPVSKKKTKT